MHPLRDRGDRVDVVHGGRQTGWARHEGLGDEQRRSNVERGERDGGREQSVKRGSAPLLQQDVGSVGEQGRRGARGMSAREGGEEDGVETPGGSRRMQDGGWWARRWWMFGLWWFSRDGRQEGEGAATEWRGWAPQWRAADGRLGVGTRRAGQIWGGRIEPSPPVEARVQGTRVLTPVLARSAGPQMLVEDTGTAHCSTEGDKRPASSRQCTHSGSQRSKTRPWLAVKKGGSGGADALHPSASDRRPCPVQRWSHLTRTGRCIIGAE